jgi:hypothetical protein
MNEIKDANLELLIELKKHLDQAGRLRALLDRLFSLAQAQTAVDKTDQAIQPQECETSHVK